MPRTARRLPDQAYLHIINRGNNRQQVFWDRLDYLVFVALLREAKRRYPLSVLGFCLMPNHFHLIARSQTAENVQGFLRWILTCFSRHCQESHHTSGHLWQGRTKSFLIDREEYLIIALRYIENNPVRAGLVASSRDWEWSSIGFHCTKRYGEMIDPPPFFIGEDWPKFVDMPLTAKEREAIGLSGQKGQSPSRIVP
jgi:putative transposase